MELYHVACEEDAAVGEVENGMAVEMAAGMQEESRRGRVPSVRRRDR